MPDTAEYSFIGGCHVAYSGDARVQYREGKGIVQLDLYNRPGEAVSVTMRCADAHNLFLCLAEMERVWDDEQDLEVTPDV